MSRLPWGPGQVSTPPDAISEPQRRIADIAAKAGEHFADYIIVVRVKDGLLWRKSDDTFAIGALDRVAGFLRRNDAHEHDDVHGEGE